MSKVSIELSAQTGGFISGIASAERSVESLTQAMKKADAEGRKEDWVRLQIQRGSLEASAFAYRNDAQKMFGGQRLHAAPGGGAAAVNVGAEYAEALKSQNSLLEKLHGRHDKFVRSGDIASARELLPQIRAAHGRIGRAIIEGPHEGLCESLGMPAVRAGQPESRSAGLEGGIQSLPKAPGAQAASPFDAPKLAGGIMSSAEAAKEAVRSLDSRIARARQEGDPKLGELQYAREKAQASAHSLSLGVERMIRNPRLQQISDSQSAGRPLAKSDEKFLAGLASMGDELKKNTAALIETAKAGSAGEIASQSAQVGTQAAELQKITGEGKTPFGSPGMQGAANILGAMQVSNAISDGFRLWAGSLDRSGIIAQYGSGDIMGARIAERRRLDNLVGGGVQTAASTIGGGMMMAGGMSGILPLAIAGGILSLGGSVYNAIRQGNTSKEASDAAYAELWQQRSADAMNLAALSGDPKFIREAFKEAADAAARFGYSAEEGMDAMRQAVQQGRTPDEANKIMQEAFNFERSTGADRGTLMGISTMSARYGAGDALQAGWAGLGASGMSTGQYAEFLRGMQRSIEDGISKGFVRSSEDVAQTLAMLAQMGGPTWQGEHGARRLSEMNAGLESATGLQSTADILVYRAARQIAEREHGPGVSYVDVMKIVQEGLGGRHGTELYNRTMALNFQVEGGGREGINELIRHQFGQNSYHISDQMFNDWFRVFRENGMDIEQTTAALRSLGITDRARPLPDTSSPELNAARLLEETRNDYAQIGQGSYDDMYSIILGEREKARQMLNGTTQSQPAFTAGMSVEEARQQYNDAVTSGDPARRFQAQTDLQIAQNPRLAAELSLEDYFSPGIFSRAQRDDRTAMNSILDTLITAQTSGVPQHISQATEFMGILNGLDRRTRNEWNTNNTLNSFAGISDISQLLNALNRLIGIGEDHLEATRENGKINVVVEDY